MLELDDTSEALARNRAIKMAGDLDHFVRLLLEKGSGIVSIELDGSSDKQPAIKIKINLDSYK